MRLAIIALLPALAAGCGVADSGIVVFENVGVVRVAEGTVDSFLTVAVRDGRIEYVGVGSGYERPRGARRVDGRGQFLIPGLWDMHVHAEEGDLPLLVSWGVTGVRDMGGSLADLAGWRRRIAADSLEGPRIVASGPALAGPPAQPGNDRWIVRNAREAEQAVDSLARLGAQLIKVHDGISRATLLAILRAARGRNLKVAGHLPPRTDPAEMARAGFTGIEHLEFVPDWCGMLFEPAGPETPDRPVPPLECDPAHMDSLVGRLAAAGVWLDPTISMFRIWVNMNQYQALYAGFRELVPALRRHRVQVLAGTDHGDDRMSPGEGLHDELALLSEAGFTPAEVLRAATVNAARYLGIADSVGSIAPGQAADLVLLEANPLADIRATRRIVMVMKAGRVIPVGRAGT